MVVEVLILNGLGEGEFCRVITREGGEFLELSEGLGRKRRTDGMERGRDEGGF